MVTPWTPKYVQRSPSQWGIILGKYFLNIRWPNHSLTKICSKSYKRHKNSLRKLKGVSCSYIRKFNTIKISLFAKLTQCKTNKNTIKICFYLFESDNQFEKQYNKSIQENFKKNGFERLYSYQMLIFKTSIIRKIIMMY